MKCIDAYWSVLTSKLVIKNDRQVVCLFLPLLRYWRRQTTTSILKLSKAFVYLLLSSFDTQLILFKLEWTHQRTILFLELETCHSKRKAWNWAHILYSYIQIHLTNLQQYTLYISEDKKKTLKRCGPFSSYSMFRTPWFNFTRIRAISCWGPEKIKNFYA